MPSYAGNGGAEGRIMRLYGQSSNSIGIETPEVGIMVTMISATIRVVLGNATKNCFSIETRRAQVLIGCYS